MNPTHAHTLGWTNTSTTHARDLALARTRLSLSIPNSRPHAPATLPPSPAVSPANSSHAWRRCLPPQLRLALLHRFPLGASSLRLRCAPAANPSSRVGLDAAGRYRLRRHRLLPLVDTASSTFMSATPPLGSVSTTSRTPARPGRARLTSAPARSGSCPPRRALYPSPTRFAASLLRPRP
jgi:hypothetical protein